MFPEVNALPGAQGQPPAGEGDREVDRGQRGADMRWHVVRAFGRVDKPRIAIGNQAFEKPVQIDPDIRIGIFLDQQRGGGVEEMKHGQALRHTTVLDPILNPIRDRIKAAAFRPNREFKLDLFEHATPKMSLSRIRSGADRTLEPRLERRIGSVPAGDGLLVMPPRQPHGWR